MEPGNRDDEQVAVRHADASGGYITKNQHEDRMRDIQVSRRGSEAASEEHSGKLREKALFEQEAPNTSASSEPKCNQKIVMNEQLVQDDVMVEEYFQNCVMDENFVKNFVMDAKIDRKVVMDLSFFINGRWNSLQPSNRKLLEEFIDEIESWVLIGIPSRDSFCMIQYLERHSVRSDQHMKELMPLREGLHVGMQCYMRQRDACFHPTSWRESTSMKFIKRTNSVLHERTDMQMECSEDAIRIE